MNPFHQALEEGYSPEEVLAYISKAIPQFTPMIKKASRAGYGVQQILGFLSKNFETEDRRGMSESERHAVNQRSDAERAKYGLKVAGSAIAAPIAAQAARTALSRAIPASLTQHFGLSDNSQNIPSANGNQSQQSLPSQTEINPTTQQTQNISSQSPVNTPNIPQNQPVTQPKGIVNPVEYLKEKGVLEKVDKMLKTGNTTEAIAATLGIKDKSGRIKAQVDPEMLQAIEEYAKTAQQQPQVKTESKVSDIMPTEKIQDVIEPAKPEKIQKAETIVTPDGDIGEVKEIRNGKAIVEVNGKKYQLKEEELEKPEFTNDEIADAYDDLMKKIPESQRSGFISWAGYDEDRNVLGFIPRESGKYEELHNITPEEAKMIKEGAGVARTTGANREGIWALGEDTRGGVISQIIHDRRRQKKASEEKQPSLFELPEKEKEDKGMKLQFGEMEYARGLSREREKKAKLAERAEKKRLKEEEKIRKKNEGKKRKKQT